MGCYTLSGETFSQIKFLLKYVHATDMSIIVVKGAAKFD